MNSSLCNSFIASGLAKGSPNNNSPEFAPSFESGWVDLRERNAVLRDTMRWLDRINDTSHPARLDHFFQQCGDVRSQEAAIHLTNSRVSDRNQSDIAALINGLAAARKRWKKEQRGKGRVTGLLPDLNGGI